MPGLHACPCMSVCSTFLSPHIGAHNLQQCLPFSAQLSSPSVTRTHACSKLLAQPHLHLSTHLAGAPPAICRVQNMINFPDYEEAFETFENLGSMQVTIVMDNVQKQRERSRVLLTGLQVPLFTKRKRVGDDDQDDESGGGAAASAAAAAADASRSRRL